LVLHDGQTFLVDVFDIPEAGGGSEDFAEMTITGMARSVESLGGRVTSRSTIKNGDCEGGEIIAQGPSRIFTQGRVFQSGQRCFMILYVSDSVSQEFQATAQYFLESLEISDGCRGGLKPVEASPSKVTTSLIDGEIDPATGWRRISSLQDGLSFSMPNQVSLAERQLQVKPIALTSRKYESTDEARRYTAIVIGEYPEGILTSVKGQEAALDHYFIDLRREVEGEAGVVTFVRNLSIGRYPGREYRFSTGGKSGKVQVFATSKRFYRFVFLDGSDQTSSAMAERFFDSVRIQTR